MNSQRELVACSLAVYFVVFHAWMLSGSQVALVMAKIAVSE